MTAGELKALCMEFDKAKGEYVESAWQGFALLAFFMEKLGKPLTIEDEEAYITEIGGNI
jgi:hypothetical protein